MTNRDENSPDNNQPGFSSFSNFTYSTISCKDVEDDPKLLECVETKKVSTNGQTKTEENTYRLNKADRFANRAPPNLIEEEAPWFSFPGLPNLFSHQVNTIFDEMNSAIPRFFDDIADINNSVRQSYNEQMSKLNARRQPRQQPSRVDGNCVHSLYNDEDLHDC